MKLCLILTLTACAVAATNLTAAAAEQPNIVWLVSEDNSVHYLQLYDPHGAPTPRIAELAEEGLLYEHAFSNSPVCSVARTTLATGCYAPRIGTQYHRKQVAVPLPEGLQMFPALLRDAGYYTANNNKTDYNVIPGKQVWDESSPRATWRKREADQPFFYMQSFPVSHESSLHFDQQTMDSEATLTDPKDVFVAPYHPDTPTFRYTNARYRDRIMAMDQQIGAVVDQLQADGLLEDTFIFYFGDHGGVLPRGKGYAYESGLHVPLVVRIPENWRQQTDAVPGSRQSGFVSFIDFGPTVLNLAGVSVPDAMDGTAFLGSGVSQDQVAERNQAFGYADRFDEKYDQVRTLRRGRYEYVRNYQPFNFDGLQNNYRYKMLAFSEWRQLYQDGQLNEQQSQFFRPRPAEQLFDVEADPHEVRDLSGDPQHAEVLQQLRQELTRVVKELPDLSFYPESVLAVQAFDNPVGFGRQHQRQIADLVDTANLQLSPVSQVADRIATALESTDPWQRYWALIVCSSHGRQAAQFTDTARELAESDPEPLVRVRAAEFLGLIEAADPGPVLIQAIRDSQSGIEIGLILNSLVLLQDGQPGYDIRLPQDLFTEQVLKNDVVDRRLQYLLPQTDN